MEDNFCWKTTFGERRPAVEEDLQWKTTFVGSLHAAYSALRHFYSLCRSLRTYHIYLFILYPNQALVTMLIQGSQHPSIGCTGWCTTGTLAGTALFLIFVISKRSLPPYRTVFYCLCRLADLKEPKSTIQGVRDDKDLKTPETMIM